MVGGGLGTDQRMWRAEARLNLCGWWSVGWSGIGSGLDGSGLGIGGVWEGTYLGIWEPGVVWCG